MLSFLFCLALFLFWWTVGYALVRSLHAMRSIVQDVLLAPPVGIVVTVLPVWMINRMGMPVGKFGWIIAAVLLPLALLQIWRLYRRGASDPRYPAIPWRMVWPFLAVLVLGLVAQARPMFAFGFDWVSYCNDDMANYCLAADRFYHNGFAEFHPEQLLTGSNWSSAFWFMHVMVGQRPGCELLLAWAMSVSGLNAHEVFMPVIIAMFLGLVCAAGALVMFPSQRRREPGEVEDPNQQTPNLMAAWTVGAMVAVSALTTLGVMYQLIAQVVGLSIVATVAAMILRPFDGLPANKLVRHGILVAIIGAGQLLIYPEVSPFLGLAFFLYTFVVFIKDPRKVVPLLAVVFVAAAGAFVILRIYAIEAVNFLLAQSQATHGDITVRGIQRTLFPYYMVPKGLADLWGFQRIGSWDTPWMLIDISIVLGAALAIFTMISAARYVLRGRPEATMAIIMFLMGLLLFRNRSGFGLFKLAMFIQPFAIGTIVISWFAIVDWWMHRREKRSRRGDDAAAPLKVRRAYVLRFAPLVLMSLAGMWTQIAYVKSAYGVGTAFLEIPDASRTRLNDEFVGILNASEPKQVISDTFNMVLGKFQALYATGRELVFPSNRYTLNIEALNEFERLKFRLTEKQIAEAYAYAIARNAKMPVEMFDVKDAINPDLVNTFRVTDTRLDPVLSVTDRDTNEPVTPNEKTGGPGGTEPLVVVSIGRQSVFNRFHFPADSQKNFEAISLSKVRDLLVYVSSDLGPPYFFTGHNRQPSVYQIEQEPSTTPFFRGATMAGAGRYMLAQVINPSPKVRMEISLTLSYHADKENRLPPMSAIGSKRVPFPVVGRGSARVFSEPFEPQIVEGRTYVMYDLGDDGRQFPSERKGLMGLFGTDVPIDRRVLTGFARDVSIVSEEQYANLRPPSWIGGFKPDATNPLRIRQLEYSGYYEDGWVAEDSYVRLLQPKGATEVVIRGEVPLLNGNKAYKNHAVLSVDGQVIAEADVTPGDFVLRGAASPVNVPATTPTPPPAGLPMPATVSAPNNAAGPVRTVRLQFTGPIQSLSAPDNRPAAAAIRSIGFQQPATVAAR